MRKSELLKINESKYKRTVTYMFKTSNTNFKLVFDKKNKENFLRVMKNRKDFSKKAHGYD